MSEPGSRPTTLAQGRERLDDGSYVFETLTSPVSYPVGTHGIIPPDKVIPIVFVPGMMGSNVRLKKESAGKVKRTFEEDGKGKDFTDQSWRPPSVLYSYFQQAILADQEFLQLQDSDPVVLGKKWKTFGPKLRQMMLDPDNTEVDDRGFLQTPDCLDSPIAKWFPRLRAKKEEARRRGWGTVHWDSYGPFLLFLEKSLNEDFVNHLDPREKGDILPLYALLSKQQNAEPQSRSPLPANLWPTETEFQTIWKFQFPVHAVGYNWTQSNRVSAELLLAKIKEYIGAYRKGGFKCDQVILISHSMGGLVSRICQKLDEDGLILGIIHGVMPSIGAPVAYRRLVAGMEGGGEAFLDYKNVFDNLAGRNTYETTPVMANAPGALELLPSHLYPPEWLKVDQLIPQRTLFALPSGNDPYTEIYREKDAWYRLVNPQLLDPALKYGKRLKNDSGPDKAWEAYATRVDRVEKVHRNWLGTNDYHKNTYAFYGEGMASFSTVHWQMDRSDSSTKEDLLHAVQKRELGNGRGQREILVTRNGNSLGGAFPSEITSAKVLFHDATGDGTVPVVSRQAPGQSVPNICRLNGFDHQAAYGSDMVRDFVLLALTKLTSLSHLAYEKP